MCTLRPAATLIKVSEFRQQAHLDAPLERVWGLVGTPTRYPEWWPRIIEVRGERFEEGEEWAQVTEDPGGSHVESNFLLERRDDLHGIRMSCQLSGLYAEWLLTPAAGGTFVDLAMGSYSTENIDTGTVSSKTDIAESAVHSWLTFGVRFVFFP